MRPTAEGADDPDNLPEELQPDKNDDKKASEKGGSGDGSSRRKASGGRSGSDRSRSKKSSSKSSPKSSDKSDDKSSDSSSSSSSSSSSRRRSTGGKGGDGKGGDGKGSGERRSNRSRRSDSRSDSGNGGGSGGRRGGGSDKAAEAKGDDRSRRRGRNDSDDQGRSDSRSDDSQSQGTKFQRDEYTFDDVSFNEIAEIREEILNAAAERTPSVSEEKKIAMFCDFENIALGVRDSPIKKFDINLVIERLLEKGKIIVKKAYCDWERYSDYKKAMHEVAIELIDIPQKYYSGKNSADIKMVVDAMDLSYSKEHLDTFVILSGDSDFSPLVSKLKENNKSVIGVGVKGSSSNLLIDNCDEFIYYEDLWRDRQASPPKVDGKDAKKNEAFRLMVDAIQALLRENKDVLWGSMIKQTMQRKKPSFNEGYYGYSTFSDLLEDAERNGLVKLKKDQRSGTYIVTGFAKR